MPYSRPPIIEAVIELRFARQADAKVIERAAKSLQTEYPFRSHENGHEIKVDAASGKAETLTVWNGEKLTSLDQADNAILRSGSFISSRLAPYLGWEQFRERTKRDWAVWRKIAGTVEISRIGVRYVNRIDIPAVANTPLRLEEYLNCYPHMPEDSPLHGYTMQLTRPVGADECTLVINSASVISPLIGFYSFALDIDVFREVEVPRRDEELWDLIERIRRHKNDVFESCITEKSRAFFG